MTTWQYRVITFNAEYETVADAVLREIVANDPKTSPVESNEIIQSRLEIMGRDGWELVSLLPAQPTAQNWRGISAANPWMYHAVFKRPTEKE
jgi:hypothetical protein